MEQGSIRQLLDRRRKVAGQMSFEEMIRGSLLKRYLECARINCRCHKSKGNRHGPYYFLAIRRKDRTKHVYVPQGMVKTIRKWVANYNRVWAGVEAITDINIKVIRLAGKKT